MKRMEITVPSAHEDEVDELLVAFDVDVTTTDVEKEDRSFVQFEFTLDSEEIDELTEAVKGIKDLETGDLTIDILEQRAQIEKGKRREGGSSSLSVQEMYTKAFEFSSFDKSSWALIGLAAGIAVFGVAMENVMVVIGAMVIAPMLGPFISLSFGFVIGDRRLIRDSIFFGTLSILFAVAIAFLLALLVPTPVNGLMRLIAGPGFATIPLSLLVGAAAALTFALEARESLAGVAVAIALVPPAAVTGIALANLTFDIFFDVLIVLNTNIMALILAGSLTFKATGVAPSTYYRQKVSEETLREALIISVTAVLVLGGIVGYISYLDYTAAQTQSQVTTYLEDEFGSGLLQHDVSVHGNQVDVRLAVVSPGMDAAALQEALAARTGRNVAVQMTAVDGRVSSEGSR